DWVWVVGLEFGQPPGNEHLYPGQVIELTHGGYVLKQLPPFEAQGFSGGPVVNSQGEVIGNVLAGSPGIISGATAGTLRGWLQQNGITLGQDSLPANPLPAGGGLASRRI
ncbi:MAG: hypothetical protein JO112_11010, partial [Planctomycetes bacterium]|nr:hypothetical protein [Planctomycetota bacterium]